MMTVNEVSKLTGVVYALCSMIPLVSAKPIEYTGVRL